MGADQQGCKQVERVTSYVAEECASEGGGRTEVGDEGEPAAEASNLSLQACFFSVIIGLILSDLDVAFSLIKKKNVTYSFIVLY